MGQGMAGLKMAAQSGNPDHLENFYDFAHRRGELTRKTREHLIGTVAANSPKARRFLEKMQIDYQALYGTHFGPPLSASPFEIEREEERANERNGNNIDDDLPLPEEPDDAPDAGAAEPHSFLRSPRVLERWGAASPGVAAPENRTAAPEEAARLRRLAELRAVAERTGSFDDRLAYVMAALGG
jgi:hypothetical protein